MFYKLRKIGNDATHNLVGEHGEALTNLKVARALGVWFHRTFADKNFKPGPFVPPPDPSEATNALHAELARLRLVVAESQSNMEAARISAEKAALARLSAEELARKEREEKAVWEQIAVEAEQSKAQLASQLASIQAVAVQATPQTLKALLVQAEAAASSIDLDEAATRELIDGQLRTQGWEVDTATLRYSAGTRPSKVLKPSAKIRMFPPRSTRRS